MDQFIGIYENAFTKEYCERTIKYFNAMQEHGFTADRMQMEQVAKTKKDDFAYFGHNETAINLSGSGKMYHEFNETFSKIYKEQYASQFDVLNNASAAHGNFSFKIQKTLIGGGYHIWHYEASDRANCQRLLTWMVYLNDVQEGGETEFLYQHVRVKPKQGTLVIWPASFTHTHRGNPPISNEKYIITGWTEF
jgi:hypothetical protein